MILLYSTFKTVTVYFSSLKSSIPLTFILQFYASTIITRWQTYIDVLPWPHTCSLLMSTFLGGRDERGKLMRRTIVRYMLLSYVVGFRDLSPQVRRRFPTVEHMVKEGKSLRQLYIQAAVPGEAQASNQ
jgi:bestrophin, other